MEGDIVIPEWKSDDNTLEALTELLSGPKVLVRGNRVSVVFEDAAIAYQWLEVMSNTFLDDPEPKHVHLNDSCLLPSSIHYFIVAVANGLCRFNKRWQYNPCLSSDSKGTLKKIKRRLGEICT